MRLGLLAVLVLIAQAEQPQPGVAYRRHYDRVVDATSELLTVVLEPSQLSIQTTIVYAGERRNAIPNRIELLIAGSGPLIGDERRLESSIQIQVDGKRFTCGTRNARDLATTNAVALVCTFDEFRVLAYSRTVAGQAYGIAFYIKPEGLIALHDLADRWASPE